MDEGRFDFNVGYEMSEDEIRSKCERVYDEVDVDGMDITSIGQGRVLCSFYITDHDELPEFLNEYIEEVRDSDTYEGEYEDMTLEVSVTFSVRGDDVHVKVREILECSVFDQINIDQVFDEDKNVGYDHPFVEIDEAFKEKYGKDFFYGKLMSGIAENIKRVVISEFGKEKTT